MVRGLGLGLGMYRAAADDGIVPDAFTFTVKTDNVGTSTDTQFTLPLPSSGTYNFDIDWGDGNSETIVANTPVTHDYGVGNEGTYTIQIGGTNKTFPTLRFAGANDRLKFLDISQWGNIAWDSFSQAFDTCSNLTISAADLPDLSACTVFTSAFQDCTSLAAIPLFDTSGVTAAGFAFEGCSSVESIAALDFSALTGSNFDMFRGCGDIALTSIPAMNFGDATDLRNLYRGCINAVTIGAITTSASLTVARELFNGCTDLTTVDLSVLNTTNVTDMANMFKACPNLDVDASGLDISSMTGASQMFISSGFSQTNYDLLLVAWEGQVELTGVTFHAGTATYTETSVDSGTVDSTSANNLADSGQNFSTTVSVGDIVHNTTDDTYAEVTAVTSNILLALDNDIMVDTETYVIQSSAEAKARYVLINTSTWTITDGGPA